MKGLSNENVIHIKKEGQEFLQFKKLLEYSDIINHAYTLGLDVNFRTNRIGKKLTKEEIELSEKSYKKICNLVNIKYENIVKPNQNHTDIVKIVDTKINKDMPDFNLEEYDNTDGLITDKKNMALATTNADCILILLFDPINKVIANIHSGWKGTLNQISKKTVQKMIKNYNCKPEDIICCICPSIRKCHFEVDNDVKELFYKEFKNLENIEEIIEKNNNKWNIDTVLINKIILKSIGLKEENIIDSNICSVCNKDIMHSYRVEKEKYGLEAAIIELKK